MQAEEQYIDSHTHLLDYSEDDLVTVVDNARTNKISKIVVNTTSSKQYQAMQELHQKYTDIVVPSFGVHPCYVSQQLEYQNEKTIKSINNPHQTNSNTRPQLQKDSESILQPRPKWKQQLISYLSQNQHSTIGQIGLDYRKNVLQTNPKPIQLSLFLQQMDLAFEMNKTVTIHCVHAYGQMLKLMKNWNKKQCMQNKSPNIIMHSYGGSTEITKSLLKLNKLHLYFSLSLKRSDQLLQIIPIQRVICQTDSPSQNNIKLLKEINRYNYNNFHKKYQNSQMIIETNQPTNVIANVLSISQIYASLTGLKQCTIRQIIVETTKRAFKMKPK